MNRTDGDGGVLPAKRMEINDDVTQIFPPSTWRFIRALTLPPPRPRPPPRAPRTAREGNGKRRA